MVISYSTAGLVFAYRNFYKQQAVLVDLARIYDAIAHKLRRTPIWSWIEPMFAHFQNVHIHKSRMANYECHYYISINRINSHQYEKSIDESNTENVEDELLTKCTWLRHSCIDFYVTKAVIGVRVCACGFFFLNSWVQRAAFTSNKLRNEPLKFGLKHMDPKIVQPENCQCFSAVQLHRDLFSYIIHNV